MEMLELTLNQVEPEETDFRTANQPGGSFRLIGSTSSYPLHVTRTIEATAAGWTYWQTIVFTPCPGRPRNNLRRNRDQSRGILDTDSFIFRQVTNRISSTQCVAQGAEYRTSSLTIPSIGIGARKGVMAYSRENNLFFLHLWDIKASSDPSLLVAP